MVNCGWIISRALQTSRISYDLFIYRIIRWKLKTLYLKFLIVCFLSIKRSENLIQNGCINLKILYFNLFFEKDDFIDIHCKSENKILNHKTFIAAFNFFIFCFSNLAPRLEVPISICHEIIICPNSFGKNDYNKNRLLLP